MTKRRTESGWIGFGLSIVLAAAVALPTALAPARGVRCIAHNPLWEEPTNDEATDLILDGDVLYVAGGIGYMDTAVRIYRLCQPDEPTLIAEIPSHIARAETIELVGTRLYTASADGACSQLFDVSDPSDPVYLGFAACTGVSDLAGENDLLCAAMPGGVRCYDLTDPSNYLVVFNYAPVGFSTNRVYTHNGTLYAPSLDQQELHIFDISDPNTIALMTVHNEPLGRNGADVVDGLLYQGTGTTFSIHDLSDPATPVLLGSLDLPTTPPFTSITSVSVNGTTAYIGTDENFFFLLDTSDPTTPAVINSAELHRSGNQIKDVVGMGSVAYVAEGDLFGYELNGYDLRDLNADPLLGSFDTPGQAQQVIVDGNLAFVANLGKGLHILDVSDPAAVTLLATHDTPGNALDLAKQGPLVYIADSIGGVQIVDVSDPSAPVLAGSIDTPGNISGIAISGDTLLASDSTQVILSFDISNPAQPVLLDSIPTPGYTEEIDLAGSLAYLSDSTGLIIISYTDPANLTQVGQYTSAGGFDSIAVTGTTVFACKRIDERMVIIDASDPTNPHQNSSYQTAGHAMDITVAGDIAYIACDVAGLELFAVPHFTQPESPRHGVEQIALYDTPGNARGVFLVGQTAYIADRRPGIQIVDVSDCPFCPADLTGDGLVDAGDLGAFITAYLAGDPLADFTCDGITDAGDLGDFITHYLDGC